MKRAAVLLVAVAVAACGKKGPPLPPLVLVPAAPAEFAAERRADAVNIRFVVPRENVDNTRPADLVRVDVYALNAVAAPPEAAGSAGASGPLQLTVSDRDVLEKGARVGSVNVRPPEDEDADPPAEPVTDVAVNPDGVDQGAIAQLSEDLTAEVVASAAASPASAGVPVRTYLAVAVSARGRTSPVSQRATVPLTPAPAPPSPPSLSYDPEEARVAWTAPAGTDNDLAFHVYELGPQAEPAAARTPRRLTEQPIAASPFVDKRIEWGVERCYTVSVVRTVGPFRVESEAAEPRCVTFTDTFAPPPPSGLTAVATEGAISLIWDPSAAADVAGYVVLRAAPGGTLEPVTSAPIQETSYRDQVATGTRYQYSVRAVDKAGNASEAAPPIEETAR